MTSKPPGQSGQPRAVIHKRILEVANDQPDASVDALAAEVSGTTPDIVERILSEYGDPAESSNDTNPTSTQDISAESTVPEPDSLTQSQRELLHAIFEHPNATQRDLAELLDISGSTVSRRAHSIDGFTWERRGTFAAAVFESVADPDGIDQADGEADDAEPDGGEPDDAEPTSKASETTSKREASTGSDPSETHESATRATDADQRVETVDETKASGSVFAAPDLLHKVIHACVKSDSITEEEELRIIQELLQ